MLPSVSRLALTIFVVAAAVVTAAVADAKPAVTSVTPNQGSVQGGTTVTLGGSGFTDATGVTFGPTEATTFTVDSDTQITVTSPSNSAGQVSVRVTGTGGTSDGGMATRFTYIARPVVMSVTPVEGPASGGTAVVLTGTGFGGVFTVSFGSTDAVILTATATTVLTIAPANSAGPVSVTVTTPGGTSDGGVNTRFTYLARPVVTGVSPDEGPVAGGTSVVITGANFGGVSAVTFGSADATSFTFDSDTQITAIAPGGSAGQVAVKVTTTGGTSEGGVASRFTYVTRPVVTGVSPGEGAVAGGTSVVITGANFDGVSAVTFGSTAATSFTFNSDTQITATSPGGSAGQVGVRVTTTGGTSEGGVASRFTYIARPVVTSLSVSEGPVAGGTTVVITGSHFTGTTDVSFGANIATFTVDSDTQITTLSPQKSAGQSAVRVTTTGGTSDGGINARFTHVGRPATSGLSPANGPTAGGTSVVITGTNFSDATDVTFGTAAAAFVVDSDTQITATSPPHAAASVAVTVTTAVGGVANVTSPFTFDPPPGTITIRQITEGGDGTFAFTSSTPELNLSITTIGGVGESEPVALPGGTYTLVAALPDDSAFALVSIACTGTGSDDVATRTATIILSSEEAVVCTFATYASRDAAITPVTTFFEARANLFLSHQPDLGRRIDRLKGAAGSQWTPATVLGYLPQMLSGGLTAAASLADIQATAGGGASRFDAWFQSSFGEFNGNRLNGKFGLLALGADYLVSDSLLLGGFLQFDTMPGATSPGGGTISGKGWLAGPYATVRLSEALFFDALAGAGRSGNTVSPNGTYSDQVEASRWLASASLTGHWSAGFWTIAPTLRASYYEETSDAYIDSLDVAIPRISAGTGQVTFGPRISHRSSLGNGIRLESSVRFDGVMNLATAPTADSGIRGRIEGGLDLMFAGGAALRLTTAYDGIGASDISTLSGGLSFSVPLR